MLSRQTLQHRTAWKLTTPLTVPEETVHQIHGLQNTLLERGGGAREARAPGQEKENPQSLCFQSVSGQPGSRL